MVYKIKNYIKNYKNSIIDKFNIFFARFNNLKNNNINQAIEYFELGMLDECYNRLRNILIFWPKEEYAKYLMGILYTFINDNKKALKYLKEVENFKSDYAQKLIFLIKINNTNKIIEAYCNNFNIYEMEHEIYKEYIINNNI